jgi:nucleotide-binding universal stress UspA family protein
MEEFKKILVVSTMTKYCEKAVHYGVSLSQKYGAELTVLHIVHDPFIFWGWNLPIPSIEAEFKKTMEEAKKELDAVIRAEKKKGVAIKELIREGKPADEILRVAKEEKTDLIILLAHEEGHLEHFLFGRSNEDIVRRMPCSVLLVKKEPEPANF